MKSALLIPAMLLSLLLTQRAHAQPACDEQSARLVAEAYVLSLPMYLGTAPEEFEAFISSHAEEFAEEGAGTRCMRALGNALAAQRRQAPVEEDRHVAQEMFGAQPELGELSAQVDSSLNRTTSDPSELGMDLQWLAGVLPSAAQGDYALLLSAGTPNRQMMSGFLPLIGQMCQLDAAMCLSVLNTLQELKPVIKEQILGYVLALGV